MEQLNLGQKRTEIIAREFPSLEELSPKLSLKLNKCPIWISLDLIF